MAEISKAESIADEAQTTIDGVVDRAAAGVRGALSTVNDAVHTATEKSVAAVKTATTTSVAAVKDASVKAQALAGEATAVAKEYAAGDSDPIKALAKLGVKSSHLYTAGVISIGLSWGGWLLSRVRNEPKSQADRNGLYVGLWAPTLFSVGLALRQEEKATRRRSTPAT